MDTNKSMASTSSSTMDSFATISMHEFLDFLKITCQVNESIDNNCEKKIDYNDLAKNELINTLLKKNSNSSNQSSPKPSSDALAGCSSSNNNGGITGAVDSLKKGTYINIFH